MLKVPHVARLAIEKGPPLMSNFGAKLHGEAMLVRVERDVLRAAPGQGNRTVAAVTGIQQVTDQFLGRHLLIFWGTFLL